MADTHNLCPSSRSSPWKSSKCWRCWKKMRASSHLQQAPARSKAPSGDCTAACDRLKRRCSNFWRRNSWQRKGEVGAGALAVMPEMGLWDKMPSSVKRVVGKEEFFSLAGGRQSERVWLNISRLKIKIPSKLFPCLF